jgi:hypothetical protein
LVKYFGGVAALLLAVSPLAAQDNATTAVTPPAPADNIGPRELSNFSLNGTVTREAVPSAQAPEKPAVDSAARNAASAGPAGSRPAPVRSATTGSSSARISQIQGPDLLSARPTVRQGSRAATAATSGVSAAVGVPPIPSETAPAFSALPWIAALLALGAGAVIYFGRRRRQERYSVAGVSDFLGESAAPQPLAPMPTPRSAVGVAPRPLVRRPEPEPAAAAPGGVVTSNLRAASPPAGIVASSLRPWIELELEPSQAMVTDEHAAIAFDVTLFNSGSAPARDVAVEACLINAGQQQDVQLSEFYTSPGDVQDRIPAVAPMARITLKSAVRLPRAAVQEYEVEGRKLFMPMVAVNSHYRWSSGEGQSAASFLVGRAANDSAKLAPLRLDQGTRGWKSLAARRYEKGIRR